MTSEYHNNCMGSAAVFSFCLSLDRFSMRSSPSDLFCLLLREKYMSGIQQRLEGKHRAAHISIASYSRQKRARETRLARFPQNWDVGTTPLRPPAYLPDIRRLSCSSPSISLTLALFNSVEIKHGLVAADARLSQ
jgi:hypothetical protein